MPLMPYIITTKQGEYPGPEAPGLIMSRRAVATLEEARLIVQKAYSRSKADLKLTEFWDAASWAYANVPESGGTVGPLPDETVIKVEQVTLSDLAEQGLWVGDFTDPAKIIAAYNEAQA